MRITTCACFVLILALLLIWQPGDSLGGSLTPSVSAAYEPAVLTPGALVVSPVQISAGYYHTCAVKADGSVACWGLNDAGQTVVPAPNTGFTQVSAGYGHSCAVKTDGSVVCWGDNFFGQLTVPAPNTDFSQVAAGGSFSCGLKTSGSVFCWGMGSGGQTNVPAPNTNFTQLSVGYGHACAVKTDHSIVCWGNDTDGQSTVTLPNANYTQVSGGGFHTCAVKTDGSVVCWGYNGNGQATPPAPNSGFTQVAAGNEHTCGLKTDGSIVCWALDIEGETFVPLPNSGFAKVSAGAYHTCAVKTDGAMLCWGSSGSGQTPIINLVPAILPGAVAGTAYNQTITANGGSLVSPTYTFDLYGGTLPPGLSLAASGVLSGTPTQSGSYTFTVRALDNNGYMGIKTYHMAGLPQISAGMAHSCVLKAGGTITCWGRNTEGQRTVPAPNSGFAQLSTGDYHNCAVKDSGSIVCWGDSTAGKTTVPPPNSGFIEVSAAGDHTCALKTDGTAVCWGDNSAGQTTLPALNSGFVQISAAGNHTCALKSDGTITCWGSDAEGESTVTAPNSGFVQVSAGGSHTCALKADGSTVCWGRGIENQTSVPAPNSSAIQISSGLSFSCALKSDGSIVCWGDNADGQGTVPQPNSGYSQVSAGGNHTCALSADGSPTCWGKTSEGQAPQINVSPATMPGGVYGSIYIQALSATGGTVASPTYTYDVLSGSPPTGLSLAANGTLGGIPTLAGAYTFSVRARDNNQYYGARTYAVTIAKLTPTATLAVTNSPVTYDGAAHGAVVTVSSSSVPGTVSAILTGGAADQTKAGTYPVTANFIPNDTDNYNTLTGLTAGSFIINKATPTATLAVTNSPLTYTGSPQAATVGVTVSSVPGAVTGILTGGAATQTNAGTYPVTATFVPTDSVNYNSLPGLAAGSLIINKATPTATLAVSNSPVTYNFTARAALVSVTVSSTPGSVTNILTGGAATQTSAGSYPVTADFVPTDGTNYNTLTGLAAGNFIINKATPEALLSVTNSPLTYDGAAHGAVVGLTASTVPGTVSAILTGGAAAQTNAGTYPVTANFIPNDSTNFNTLTAVSAGNLIINKATPTATLAVTNSPLTYTGSPQAAMVGITVSSVPGSASSILTGGAAVQTNAGTYPVTASFVPADSTNYNTLTNLAAGNLIINKANPVVTLAVNNSPVSYDGIAHAATVSKTTQVAGTLVNIKTGGAANQINAGVYPVTADFAPTDTANYNTLTNLVAGDFVISKVTPTATLTVTNSPITYDGAAHGAVVTVSASSVPGTVSAILTGGAAAQTNANAYPVTANFIPDDSTNYNTLTALNAGFFIIKQAEPTATLAVTNTPLTYDGAAHGAVVAVTVSSVPGTVSNILTGGAADQTNAGTYPVFANFIPVDNVNYSALTNLPAGNLIINKADPAVTLTVTNSPVTYNGAPQAAAVSKTTLVAGTLSNIKTGGAAAQTNAGTYPVTADFAPTDTVNYNTLTNLAAGDFIIEKATPLATLTVSNSPIPYDGAAHTPVVDLVTQSVPGALANIKVGGAATQTNASTYPVTADFVPTDTINFNTLTGLSAGNFIIEKATPTLTLTVSNTPVTYDGLTHAAQVEIAASSAPGTLASIQTGGAADQTQAGTYAVTTDFIPTDSANYNSLSAFSAGDFVIEKAPLTVRAVNLNKKLGAAYPLPVPSYAFSGFVNGEDQTVLTGAPQLTLNATVDSPVGHYPITITAGTLAADNYSFTFVDGELIISSAICYLPYLGR